MEEKQRFFSLKNPTFILSITLLVVAICSVIVLITLLPQKETTDGDSTTYSTTNKHYDENRTEVRCLNGHLSNCGKCENCLKNLSYRRCTHSCGHYNCYDCTKWCYIRSCADCLRLRDNAPCNCDSECTCKYCSHKNNSSYHRHDDSYYDDDDDDEYYDCDEDYDDDGDCWDSDCDCDYCTGEYPLCPKHRNLNSDCECGCNCATNPNCKCTYDGDCCSRK